MGIKELSLELAAISLVADQAKKRKDELRAQLKAEMDAIGADRVKAEIDGQSIGYVTTTKPRKKLTITNRRYFIQWVKENYPTEIIEEVRESFEKVILPSFRFEHGMAISTAGEMVGWLVEEEGEPYLTTKLSAEGREMLIDALSGQNFKMEVSLEQLLEIE